MLFQKKPVYLHKMRTFYSPQNWYVIIDIRHAIILM